MIAEITVLPIGEGAHMSRNISGVIDLIARSGLRHQVTAMGTLVEGEPDRVWSLMRSCHEAALAESGRVVTELRVDDGGTGADDLISSVTHVEEQLGKQLSR